MSPELERLIALQDLETRLAAAEARIAQAPEEIAALDAKLNAAREAVTAAKQAVSQNQEARRALDKDLHGAEQRLSKYKEQLMAVKTNDEYHAMQHQIAAASGDVARVEEGVLVNMMDADERAAQVTQATAALKGHEAAIATERAAIEASVAAERAALAAATHARAELLPGIDRNTRDTFDRVLKGRGGIAVAKAVDGHCSLCHVRLRPQVYHQIVRNEGIVQCDSCQRILYYAGERGSASAVQATLAAASDRQRELEQPPSSS